MHVWQEHAANHEMPQWFRVLALAYGCHRANGHAPFPPGALALALGRPDRLTGELIPEPNPGRVVRTAVRYGFIAEGSTVRCLIVKAHHIEGPNGDPRAECPVHGRSAR